MLGAIIGDICGSIYEFNSVTSKDFTLISPEVFFTDDTVLTVAIAQAVIMKPFNEITNKYVDRLRFYTKRYPDMDYGLRFLDWISSKEHKPYNSYGNGSAMRVSSIGFYYNDIDEVLQKAKESAEITHNHPEGIKGAQAVALAIFLARNNNSKSKIKQEIEKRFQYNLNRTLKEIEKDYDFYETCQDSVPEAIIAFLESTDFETAIRNAIWLKGDADTQACIAGSIAEAYYKSIHPLLIAKAFEILPMDFKDIIHEFYSKIDGNYSYLYARPLSNQTIEKLLSFLPYLSTGNGLGYDGEYSDEADEFRTTAIRGNFALPMLVATINMRTIINFKKEGVTAELINKLDLTTIRASLSLMFRQERMFGLVFSPRIKDKTIEKILLRVKTIHTLKKQEIENHEKYKLIKNIINKDFCIYYDKYDFKKYSFNDYEIFKNDFSSLRSNNKSIENALKWKWGHANKTNYPESHKRIIKEIETSWEDFIKSEQTSKPQDTFNYWKGILKRHNAFITIAYITHLIHNKEIPIIDQHNYRAMNYFMQLISEKFVKKKPSNWDDLLDFNNFFNIISKQMHISKGDLDKYLMMKGKDIKKLNLLL